MGTIKTFRDLIVWQKFVKNEHNLQWIFVHILQQCCWEFKLRFDVIGSSNHKTPTLENSQMPDRSVLPNPQIFAKQLNLETS